jgi:hypothetical protein
MSKEAPKATGSVAEKPAGTATVRQAGAPSLRTVDRPELAETFADCITGAYFDGQTLRLEFGVTRLDPMRPNQTVTGRRYPACRLVLSPAAAGELAGRMQQIGNAVAQAAAARSGRPAALPLPRKSRDHRRN